MSHTPRTISGIVDLASAFYGSAVLFAAVEIDLFTQIEHHPDATDAESLAEILQADTRGLRLLLDACVASGLLEKTHNTYQNTDASRLALVTGGPADLSQAIRYNRDVYPAWGRLPQLVKTGRPVEAPENHLGADPERTRRFVLSMRGRALAIGQAVVPMIDLSGCTRLLDLAGGPGAYAILLAQANPGLHCTTVDLPAVSAVAQECVDEAGMTARVRCQAGDYHTDTWPVESFDAVTLFGALHQESSATIIDILTRAHQALKPGGKLFVLDMMTDASRTQPVFSALFAVNMALSTHNGWVFSDDELKHWMRQVGFVPGETHAVPPPMPHWLVDGIKQT